MSLLIYVDGYPGCPANERPKQFTLDDQDHDIPPVEFEQVYYRNQPAAVMVAAVN